MKKKFLCVWTGGSYTEQIENNGIEFFVEDRGFFEDDIYMINNLEIGQHYSPDMGMHVIRMEDIK